MSIFNRRRPDRFRALTWIYWVQLMLLLVFGLFCFFMGLDFWNGRLDALGDERRELGRNLCLGSSLFFLIATLPLGAIAGRFQPLLRCYREGIECRLLGRSELDDIPLMPEIVRLVWALFTRQTFRRETFRIEWKDFGGASVTGIATIYKLNLFGRFLHQESGKTRDNIVYDQAAFRQHPKKIAETLNAFLADADERAELVSWHDMRIT